MVSSSTTAAAILITVLVDLHQCIGPGDSEASEIDLKIKSCACPGYMLTVECTVNGTSHGVTVWKGEFFDCLSKEIPLLHSRFTTEVDKCNNGSVVGKGLKIENNLYTSQLNIILKENMIGKTIQCYYEGDGQTFNDSVTVNVTGNFSEPHILYPISEVNMISGPLMFNWSPVAPNCPAVQYNIASNCGSCPNTTNHTTLNCTDVPTHNSMCTFAVQAVVSCGNSTETLNDTISVSLSLTNAPYLLVNPAESLSLFAIGIFLIFIVIILLIGLITCFICRKMMKRSSRMIPSIHNNQINEDNNFYTVRVFDNQKMGTYGIVDEPDTELQSYASVKGTELPDLNSILNVLHNEGQAPFNWYLYGLALDVPKVILDQLKVQDYSEDDCLVEVLDYWLRHLHNQPTWEDVMKAKKKVEFHELAKNALL